MSNLELLTHKALSKSKIVAYLLGAFLGGFGVHRLYLKEYIGFFAYVFLTLASFVQPILSVSVAMFLVFDFFYTWVLVDRYNDEVMAIVKGNDYVQ